MKQGKILQKDFKSLMCENLLELHDCPEYLYYQGSIPKRQGTRFVTVVGSRNPSPYAKQALEYIISGLKGQSVCIVSGLALGVDGLAHRMALEQGIPTVALPGSGLNQEVLYPATHRQLARDILESGGCLLSEFEPSARSALWTFPKRNRLMARMADLVMVVEAREKSGTLITARNASEYGVDVAVVPGSIFNENARGSNNLLQEGAHVVTNGDDVLRLLGITKTSQATRDYDDVGGRELEILSYLVEPKTREQLLELVDCGVVELSEIISLLGIKGYVVESLGLIYKK